jgi:hypothetical protein
MAARDALFIMLARESLQSPAVPSIDLMAGGAFATPVGSSAPVADSALALPRAFGAQTFVDQPTLLTPWTNQEGLRSDRPDFDLLDDIWADQASQAPGADSFFAMVADDASAAE